MVSISTSQEYVIQGSVHEAIGLKASIHIGLICFLNHSVNNQYNISNCCQFGFWDGGYPVIRDMAAHTHMHLNNTLDAYFV